MALILDIASWVVLCLGSLVLVAAALVIVRMPTFYTRLHAASVNETLGPGLILLGLVLQSDGNIEVILKLVLILAFLVLTGPIAGHALAKAALDNGLLPGKLRREEEGEPPLPT